MRKIIVGSRRSKLAITQTNWVISQLQKLDHSLEFEVKEIVTKGDVTLDVTLNKVGGKGLFVKEIEQAMINKEIDIAVHSMKDMPAILQKGLIVGCIPPREDHRDVLISKNNVPLKELKKGAIVGTSSLRRSAQLLAVRPDLQIKWIRGNIDTRLKKLETSDYDAIVLAAAGLARMGWTNNIVTEFLDIECCLPAVGQGALAIECRDNDKEILELLSKISSVEATRTVFAERAFLKKMDGGCQVPIAAYAQLNKEEEVFLTALVISPDGKTIYKEQVTGSNPVEVGERAAAILTAQGAKTLIDKLQEEQNKNG